MHLCSCGAIEIINNNRPISTVGLYTVGVLKIKDEGEINLSLAFTCHGSLAGVGLRTLVSRNLAGLVGLQS